MKSSEILTKAKNIILERGWGQGDEETVFNTSDTPPCCVATALSYACNASINEMDGYRRARDWFTCANDMGGYDTIVKWNDAPERTKDEVLAAFDAAIALSQRKESEAAAAG